MYHEKCFITKIMKRFILNENNDGIKVFSPFPILKTWFYKIMWRETDALLIENHNNCLRNEVILMLLM